MSKLDLMVWIILLASLEDLYIASLMCHLMEYFEYGTANVNLDVLVVLISPGQEEGV